MTEPQDTKQALSPEVDQAIRRIEDIGASLSAQAYSYRKSGASNRNRPLLAKNLLRLIERVEEAGKVFRSPVRSFARPATWRHRNSTSVSGSRHTCEISFSRF